jgi:hypothetical protein
LQIYQAEYSLDGITMRAPSWPKLIGTFVLIFGVAWSLQVSQFIFSMEMTGFFARVRVTAWSLAVGGSIVSVVVGLAAYAARAWARATLVTVTAVAIVLALAYSYVRLTRYIAAPGTFEPEFIVWTRLVFAGEALRAIAPPVFFLILLLHPDVARSFKHAATRTV